MAFIGGGAAVGCGGGSPAGSGGDGGGGGASSVRSTGSGQSAVSSSASQASSSASQASSSASQASSTSSSSSGGAISGCGSSVYSDPICRAWLDQYCCPQEKACATNCQQIIACINACPAPPTDACINACTQKVTPEGMAQLDAIANCSKVVPQPPNNMDCAWPK